MKAMILAAGRGERMRPLTDDCPKPLLQVAGKALIEYHIDALAKAGITELVINHAYLGLQIERYLGDGEKYGVMLKYSPEREGGLETGGGIFQALPLLGETPFVVINGDIWCDYDFAQLPSDFEGQVHLVMVDNPPHNPGGDFYFDRERLLPTGQQKLTFSGIGLYRPEWFASCKPGRYPLAPMLRESIKLDQVSAEHYSGLWWDIGTPERLGELNQKIQTSCV